MGEVYRALDPKLPRRRVAIKTLTSLSPPDRERFKREAEAISMASMSSRHVVKIFEFGDDEDGSPYIVMELLHGEDLGAAIRSGPLEISRAVDIILGVCSGAWACHRRGILHRDIKPKNIVLHMEDEGEVVKILDFGVSVYPFSAEITGPYQVMGTPRYMSPEQLEGRVVDERSDIYAIGVVLYECLTGRLPFEGQDDQSRIAKILGGQFAPPSQIRPEIPVELDRIVRRAMSRDPDDRFPTARDFGQSLIPFANEARQVVFTETFVAPVRPMVERMTAASSQGTPAGDVVPRDPETATTSNDGPRPGGSATIKVPSGVVPLEPLVEKRGDVRDPERTEPEEERNTVRYDAAPTVVVASDQGRVVELGSPEPDRGRAKGRSRPPVASATGSKQGSTRAAEEAAHYEAGGTRRVEPPAQGVRGDGPVHPKGEVSRGSAPDRRAPWLALRRTAIALLAVGTVSVVIAVAIDRPEHEALVVLPQVPDVGGLPGADASKPSPDGAVDGGVRLPWLGSVQVRTPVEGGRDVGGRRRERRVPLEVPDAGVPILP